MAKPTPGDTPPDAIRNFCIIAHIDHGKSTLADRMLQLTACCPIGSAAPSTSTAWTSSGSAASPSRARPCGCRTWRPTAGDYVLNLIDTPGHVDFTYEVSRSLAACEGAILLVDAAQGIEAQTLANLYLALDNDLAIIPVLNKIDLPAAEPDKYAAELAHIIGCDPGDVLRVSAKTGDGVAELLAEVVATVPAAGGQPGRARPGPDLRLGVRRLPRRRDLRPRGGWQAQQARADPDDIHRGHPRDARAGRDLPGADGPRAAGRR